MNFGHSTSHSTRCAGGIEAQMNCVHFLPLWYVKTYSFISNALFVLCFLARSNKQIRVIVVTKWSHLLTIPILFITTYLVHENGVIGPSDLTSTPAQT
jgi:hypothetical protein